MYILMITLLLVSFVVMMVKGYCHLLACRIIIFHVDTEQTWIPASSSCCHHVLINWASWALVGASLMLARWVFGPFVFRMCHLTWVLVLIQAPCKKKKQS